MSDTLSREEIERWKALLADPTSFVDVVMLRKDLARFLAAAERERIYETEIRKVIETWGFSGGVPETGFDRGFQAAVDAAAEKLNGILALARAQGGKP